MENARLSTDTKRGAVIVGTGGFARELADVLRSDGRKIDGFIGPAETELQPYLGDDNSLSGVAGGSDIFVAIGDPHLRERLFEKIRRADLLPMSLLHPDAFVAKSVKIGVGVIIYPNAAVHAGVVLGDGAFVNSNASLGHDTKIGAYSTVGPGSSLGGHIAAGRNVYFGLGCTVRENVSITDNAVIGAGAVVVKDIDQSDTFVGVPARKIIR